jgi:hypothetical protein
MEIINTKNMDSLVELLRSKLSADDASDADIGDLAVGLSGLLEYGTRKLGGADEERVVLIVDAYLSVVAAVNNAAAVSSNRPGVLNE